ncbi:hypothetical protein P7C71_g5658, partial [Lecanoromycetidae sp. Uapishka_2]
MSQQPIEVDDQEDGDTLESLPRVSSDPEPESAVPSSKCVALPHTLPFADAPRNSTRSLSGSFLEEHFENSRRYCNETYYMPNDSEEETRLAIAHQAYLLVLNSQLTLAHIPSTATRILDIGTGTGDWAIATAERLPNAEIVATDITTAFWPSTGPPNLMFELDDAQEEWAYNEGFDFVHVRGMSGAFGDWVHLYGEVAKHLRPRGLLEVKDQGFIKLRDEPKDSWLSVFNGAVQSAAEKAGRPIGLEHLKKQVFEEAGLSVVKSKSLEVPLGLCEKDPTKKLAGKMAMIVALEGLEAVSLRLLTKQLAWKEGDVRDLCAKVKEEVMNPNARAYVVCQIVVARKLMI